MATHTTQVILSDRSLAGTTHESIYYRIEVMYPQAKRQVLSGRIIQPPVLGTVHGKIG